MEGKENQGTNVLDKTILSDSSTNEEQENEPKDISMTDEEIKIRRDWF